MSTGEVMKLPKLTRLLALSSLIGMFVLSLQSLQLRYIEQPALLAASKALFTKQNSQITRANKDLKQLSTGIVNQAVEIASLKDQVDQLQLSLMTSKANESAAGAKQAIAEKAAADALLAAQETNDAADGIMAIIHAQYMPIDQCVVVKAPPCMNGTDELTGKVNEDACGI